MSTALGAVSLLGGLIVLAGFAAAIVVYIRGTARDLEAKRLREDRDDYLSRLNFIEPRYEALKTANDELHKIADPGPALEKMSAAQRAQHVELMAGLDKLSEHLAQIETRIHVPKESQ